MGEFLGNAYEILPPIIAGVFLSLYGYGIIPEKKYQSEVEKKKAKKTKELFRWVGPLAIVAGIVLAVIQLETS